MKLFFLSLIVIISISSVNLFAQDLVDIKNTSTCETAYDLSRFKQFGPTTAPLAVGNLQENSFSQPKHPTWYKFTIKQDGILLFDIIPTKPTDNYDFLLFKDEGDFCSKFKNNTVKAIRSNFSAPDTKNFGYTGLSFSGENSSYEKNVHVKKGEQYYLVLNNAYDNGKGHTITFKYLKTYNVNGKITSSKNSQGLKSKIKWKSLRTPEIVVETTSNKNGEYNLEIVLDADSNKFPKYIMCVTSEKYFPYLKIIPTKDAITYNNKAINISLHKIKKGYNNKALGIIYFLPNENIMVPEADFILKKLMKTLNENKDIEIVLEGHTNGLFPSTDVDITLSKERAELIKEYLVKKGISENRIKTEGLGGSKKIYPAPQDEKEEGANRRVEIRISKI